MFGRFGTSDIRNIRNTVQDLQSSHLISRCVCACICVRESNARANVTHNVYTQAEVDAETLSILIYYFHIKSSSWHQFSVGCVLCAKDVQ